MRILLTLACAGAVVQQLTRGFAATLDPNLAAWLAVQTNVVSWSADFLQTRSLKSLTRPLTATGRVWFAAPNRFRWELGHPPQTIAVRDDREMRLIYPRLKRVERFPLNTQGPWRDALALLEAGFPRSQVQLEHQYTLLSQKLSDETCVLSLRPKSPEARRMMPQNLYITSGQWISPDRLVG